MMAITIFFAMLGMLSPASRGALLTASIFVYEFMGLVAGYFAGRLYKTLKGKVRDIIPGQTVLLVSRPDPNGIMKVIYTLYL